ncbi:unnamed protein product [Closterium sp. Naga37s-1]|nr:unnamed protein product [Closterium sp. Naga37s-1]
MPAPATTMYDAPLKPHRQMSIAATVARRRRSKSHSSTPSATSGTAGMLLPCHGDTWSASPPFCPHVSHSAKLPFSALTHILRHPIRLHVWSPKRPHPPSHPPACLSFPHARGSMAVRAARRADGGAAGGGGCGGLRGLPAPRLAPPHGLVDAGTAPPFHLSTLHVQACSVLPSPHPPSCAPIPSSPPMCSHPLNPPHVLPSPHPPSCAPIPSSPLM